MFAIFRFRQTITTPERFAIDILNFDRDAEVCYNNLRQNNRNLAKKRLGKDLRIASIALMQNAIVVTRNYKDFSQVPNLQLDNWVD